MKILITLCCSILLFLSCKDESFCSSETLSENNNVHVVSFTIKDFEKESIESRTNVTVDGKGAHFSWAITDTIGIFPSKGNQIGFAMSDGDGTQTATFTGGGWGLKANSTYSAYYPLLGRFYLDKTKIPLDYTGQSQKGNGSTSHMGYYDYLAAPGSKTKDGNCVSFNFDHLSSLVQIKLTPTHYPNISMGQGSYKKLQLTCEEGFVVKALLDLPSMEITTVETSKTITLDLGNVGSYNDGTTKELYLMLSPVNLKDKKITATLFTDISDQYYTTTLIGKNFEAGKIYALTETDNILDITVNTPGTLMDELGGIEPTDVDEIKISGTLNNTDVITLRKMSKLRKLDIENVQFTTIDSENSYYHSYVDSNYNTEEIGIQSYTDGIYGQEMFSSYLPMLESVVWSKHLTTVPFATFRQCRNLKKIEFKGALYTIGSDAFAYCGFKAFEIPAGVKTINNPFSGCTSLTDLTIEAGNTSFYAKNGIIYNYDMRTLIFAAPGFSGEFVVPNTVTSIKSGAFSGTGITSIKFNSQMNYIPSSVCKGCDQLSTVIIPDNVKSINYGAFWGCSNLSSINWPTGLETIGDHAFRGCNFSSLTIPEGVTSIGAYAFFSLNSRKLDFISFPSTLQYIYTGAFLYSPADVIYWHCLLDVFVEGVIEDSARLDGPLYPTEYSYSTVHIRKGTTIQQWGEKIYSLQTVAKEVIADL